MIENKWVDVLNEPQNERMTAVRTANCHQVRFQMDVNTIQERETSIRIRKKRQRKDYFVLVG